jgi:hypothetical protein
MSQKRRFLAQWTKRRSDCHENYKNYRSTSTGSDLGTDRFGTWFILRSSDGGVTSVGWGIAEDVPVPADYDGDGKADIAVYRDGIWFIFRSSDGAPLSVRWGGLPQDIPVPGDFDGDGIADVAIYRDGMWVYFPSSNTACEGCWDY